MSFVVYDPKKAYPLKGKHPLGDYLADPRNMSIVWGNCGSAMDAIIQYCRERGLRIIDGREKGKGKAQAMLENKETIRAFYC